MIISHLSNSGFGCRVCGDGVSYPNKFIRAMLNQLDVNNLKHEYQPEWAKPYFYDNYFEYNNISYILEVDGMQHLSDVGFMKTKLDEVIANDEIKNRLAVQHGIVVIRIDCRYSNFNYIKNSILNSELSKICDLSLVDWVLCESQSRCSLVDQVCSFYNSLPNVSVNDIAKHFSLSVSTVRKYLTIGNIIRLCDYVPKKKYQPVMAMNIMTNTVFHFNSITECVKEITNIYNIKISASSVGRVCRGEYESCKGFIFQYE